MSGIKRSVALLLVQTALVLSVAGKYLYERKVCPRVWVRTAQFDPNMPLRGRYMALQLTVDACGLPHNGGERSFQRYGIAIPLPQGSPQEWRVRLQAKDGKLVPVLAADQDKPEETDLITLWPGRSCDRATVSQGVDYFIPDTAKTPWPMKPGEELWVEVTVPPMGPPRPIQLAVSQDGVFTVLKL